MAGNAQIPSPTKTGTAPGGDFCMAICYHWTMECREGWLKVECQVQDGLYSNSHLKNDGCIEYCSILWLKQRDKAQR